MGSVPSVLPQPPAALGSTGPSPLDHVLLQACLRPRSFPCWPFSYRGRTFSVALAGSSRSCPRVRVPQQCESEIRITLFALFHRDFTEDVGTILHPDSCSEAYLCPPGSQRASETSNGPTGTLNAPSNFPLVSTPACPGFPVLFAARSGRPPALPALLSLTTHF